MKNDESETQNAADGYSEMVEKIKVLADDMRSPLGDSLRDVEGNENRKSGHIE